MAELSVVVGRPGTGKTTRLLNIVDDALASGMDPKRIGFFSFTKKAAEEGRQRAMERFKLSERDLPHFRTLHSFAFNWLGLRRDSVVSWRHYRELGDALGVEFKGKAVSDGEVYGMNSADRMLFMEGLAKNRVVGLKKIWEEAMEDEVDWWELERFSRAFTSFKASRGLVDYNDMLERVFEIPSSGLPKFDLLLVDEAQDLSTLQWNVVDKLIGNSKKTYVCGDDLQAIYQWSGANVDRFIDLPGERDVLGKSYRIPSAVHEVADSISRRISRKIEQGYLPKDDKGQVNWFTSVEEVDLGKGTWLLLARNGYMLEELENYCMYQGWSFDSISRSPLKSQSLQAIKVWENLRRGQGVFAGSALMALKYATRDRFPASGARKLESMDDETTVTMEVLKDLGLTTVAIWHEALNKIAPSERDYFIAARRRGEPLLKEPRIKISTIHSSKGGEADHVLLLTDVSHRCWKNMQDDFDSEGRVFYVAVTRAKSSLNLVLPKTNLNFEI